MWYVPLSVSESVLEVPPMTYSSPEQEELGRKAYEAQKVDRDKTNFSTIPDSPFVQIPGTRAWIALVDVFHICLIN